jgi:hypothetical protein
MWARANDYQGAMIGTFVGIIVLLVSSTYFNRSNKLMLELELSLKWWCLITILMEYYCTCVGVVFYRGRVTGCYNG